MFSVEMAQVTDEFLMHVFAQYFTLHESSHPGHGESIFNFFCQQLSLDPKRQESMFNDLMRVLREGKFVELSVSCFNDLLCLEI
jgi:hypothetical protein